MSTVVLTEKQAELLDLLTAGASAKYARASLKISHGRYYELRRRLVTLGVLVEKGTPLDVDYSSVGHSLGLHAWWSDGAGDWGIQIVPLDHWRGAIASGDESSVIVRLCALDLKEHRWCWTVPACVRWTTTDTERHFLPGMLTTGQLHQITRTVAHFVGVEAVLPPEPPDPLEFVRESDL